MSDAEEVPAEEVAEEEVVEEVAEMNVLDALKEVSYWWSVSFLQMCTIFVAVTNRTSPPTL